MALKKLTMAAGFVLIYLSIITIVSGFYVQPEIPEFLVHPNSSLLLVNSSKVLTCSLRLQTTPPNVPHPQIAWLVNGTEISEIFSSGWSTSTTNDSLVLMSLLRISMATIWHGGYYQCLAKDGMGEGPLCNTDLPIPCISSDVVSDGGLVHVITGILPEVRQRNASLNSSILLECGSDIAPQHLVVTWRENGELISDSSDTFQLGDGDLLVYVSKAGQVKYDCYVTTDTNEHVHHRAYRVITLDRLELEMTSEPVSIHATNSVLSSGDSTQLACLVAPGNSSATAVSWFKMPGGSMEEAVSGDEVTFHGRILTLLRVQGDRDEGTYCCRLLEQAPACVAIVILDQEEEYPQHQQFIDFRQNSTHCISTTCPLPPGSVQTQWFRNGRRMDNSTLRNLTRCASDPYQLYGVYQCTAKLGAGRAHQLVEKVILASRVLPYGISNPVGNITAVELPQPSLSTTLNSPILISWTPPTYTGNLSSVSYKVSLRNPNQMVLFSSSEELKIYVNRYSLISAHVAVYHKNYGAISSEVLMVEYLNFVCYGFAFFPPQILGMSCSSGLVLVNYTFDEERNRNDFFTLNYPKEFYFRGNCSNNQSSYQVLYEHDLNSPYSVGENRIFEAGTTCTLSAANTPSRSILDRDGTKGPCYRVEDILYSSFRSCVVKASVGFTLTSRSVKVSSQLVEVCVASQGYGFTANISCNSSDFIDYRTVLDFRTPAQTAELCMNLSLTYKGMPGEVAMVFLTITTDSTFVVIGNSSILLAIENDAAVGFVSDQQEVRVSAGHFQVCIWSRGIGFTIYVSANSSQVAVFPPTFNLSSTNISQRCVSVPVSDNGITGSTERLALAISTDHPLVIVSNNSSYVTVINDVVPVKFYLETKSVMESSGGFNVCVVLENTMLGNATAFVGINGSTRDGDTISERLEFVPGGVSFQCLYVNITDDDVLEEDREWTFRMSSNSPAVRVTPSVATVTVLDDDKVQVSFSQRSYSINCTRYLNICANMTGCLGKPVTAVANIESEINFSKVFEFNADTPTLQCSKTYMGNWDAAPRQFKVVLRCNQSNGIEVSVNETLVMVESGCYTYLLVGVVTGVSIVILGLCIAVACVVLSVKVQKKRARNSYETFQKTCVKSFDQAEDDNGCLVLEDILIHHDNCVEEDNISQLEFLEPEISKNSSRSQSPISLEMSSILEPAKDLGRTNDDSGYINNLDKEDDRLVLLQTMDNELGCNPMDNPETSVINSSVTGSSTLCVYNPLFYDSNPFTESLEGFGEATFPPGSAAPDLMSPTATSVSSGSICSDLSDEDSGYPRHTHLDSDHVSVT